MQLFNRYFFCKSSSIEFIYIYYLCWYNFLLYSDGIKTNIDFVLCYELITLVYIIMRDNSNTPRNCKSSAIIQTPFVLQGFMTFETFTCATPWI